MLFEPLSLAGAYLILPESREDSRGLFARTYCELEFAAHGLPTRFVQCNTSFNTRRGTLRGMHFQREPKPEPKLVRCTRGSMWDVVIDLRPNSATYCRSEGIELTADNRAAVFIPPGFAHGFQTLEDGTELLYHMGEFYDPALASGVRWNDPAFGIRWPITEPVLSDRDKTYPDFRP